MIRPDKYFENTLNILQHLTRVEQDRLGSPVNKTLWNTAPAVVNAYYSRSKNRISQYRFFYIGLEKERKKEKKNETKEISRNYFAKTLYLIFSSLLRQIEKKIDD